jgi:hypothetical protein
MATRRKTGPATTVKARTAQTATRRQFLTIAGATAGTTTVFARSPALAGPEPQKTGAQAKKEIQVALICIADWAGAVRQVLGQLNQKQATQIGGVKLDPVGGRQGCPPNQGKVNLCMPVPLDVGVPVSLADLSRVLNRIEESAESLRRGIDLIPPDGLAAFALPQPVPRPD